MNAVACGRTRKSPEDEENCHVIIHDKNFLWIVYTNNIMYTLRYIWNYKFEIEWSDLKIKQRF